MPNFVFVHGAWHNRATWAEVAPLLEAQGGRTRSLDLPGAGANAKQPKSFSQRPLDAAAFAAEPSPNAGVTQAERTAAVIAEIDALGGDVVLVGHSLGGLTVSAVAEAAPEKLRAAVYLTAFMLPPKMLAVEMIQHESMTAALVPSLLRADPAAVGALRLDVASTDPEYRAKLRECFYGDVAAQTLTPFLGSLHCDEPLSVCVEPSPVTPDRFGRVRRAYIRCTQDRAIPLSGQNFMLSAMEDAGFGKTEVVSLDASHSPFLSKPRELADLLVKIAA